MRTHIQPSVEQVRHTSQLNEEHLEKNKTEKNKCKSSKISIYRNSYDTKGIQTTLAAIYKRITTGGRGLKQKTKKARRLATENPTAYKQFKAANFIAPTFAGTFPKTKRQQHHLGQHSGLIVLDIDGVPPLTLYALIAHLNHRDDILLAFLSPSGIGLKVIVRISPIPQDAAEHKAAYQAVIKHFTDLAEKYKFEFDQSGSDCSRLCYLAHDRDAIYHRDASPIAWDREQYQKIQATLTVKKPPTDYVAEDIDTEALDYVDPTNAYDNPNAYDTWYKVGIAIKSAGLSFDVWDSWSQKDPKYQDNAPGEMLRKWESFTETYAGNSIGWGTVIHYAKQSGYTPPRRSNRSHLLQIDTTEVEKRKEQRASRNAVESALNDDIKRFINTPKSDKPQFTILPYETGTGKSTTTLMHAKEAGHRVIALLQNHKLAKDQTTAAQKMGFNTFRFRGRGYNFEKSKLALLPVAMREQDETLFEKHNVTCPINDVVEITNEKRISPLYRCRNCPLLGTCKQKGYWSQFKQIQRADYLSISMQTLVFNPDLWAFLNMVLCGKIPFEKNTTEETAEETAIATMLGLETDTEKTIKPFDFVIIDDYTVSGLYTDVSYTIEELADLMHAWHGTKTGEVIETIYRAFWELHSHQKHENTEPAIKILRELFASLDPETREIVNENLTKHAHRTPEGEIEPISPITALCSGVKLENLTPVWHSKDWTLLHQLEAMLNHCKNDVQAPIYQIITKDTAKVIFTIPPQIHPQMNKVLFLSATANIAGTQAAFYGKEIGWRIGQSQPPSLAKGVRLFQYVESRTTASSVFETDRDTAGNVIYTQDCKPKHTGQLTNPATEILKKVAALVKNSPHKSLLTSYKAFVDGTFAHLETVQHLHDAFDTITHYDIAAGRNFQDYKVFVIYGYPKIKLRVIKKAARRQYAHDPNPLCFDYEYITITENGYTSTARRFTDSRVEKVRQQLTTDKLKQAIGRARITRWEDTIVLCITNEPVPGFTELATPFTYAQLLQAPSIEEITTPPSPPDPLPPITTAEKIIAYREQHPAATHAQIAQQLGITRQAVTKSIAQKTHHPEIESHIMQPNPESPIKYLHGNCVKKLHDVTFPDEPMPPLRLQSHMQSHNCLKVTQLPISAETCKTDPESHVTLQNEHTLKAQILCYVVQNSPAKTAEIITAVDGQPTAIKNELNRLLQAGEIVKIKHGVYAITCPPNLPPHSQHVTEPTPERDIFDISDTVSKRPKPRPPIPSKKPKPQETEIQTPPPVHDPKIPPVREITESNPPTALDLYDPVFKWECLLFDDEIRLTVHREHPELSPIDQEQLIDITETLIRRWIERSKKYMSFEERARLCIAFAEYKRSDSQDTTQTPSYENSAPKPGCPP